MPELLHRARIDISYEGQDISRDISPDLINFTYTDNEGGKADDIAIILRNDHGLWSGAWLPTRGDRISATIVHEKNGETLTLYCGAFTVDELESYGPPSLAAIKGASVPTDSSIMRTKRSRAWEQVRLSEMVQDVASSGALAVRYFIDNDPLYDRRDQRDETDMAFLRRMCDEEGFNLKCTDSQLVVFDPREQSKSSPVVVIRKGESNIKGWRFRAQSHDTYRQCTVEYFDPEEGKVNKFTYVQPDIVSGKDKKVVQRAASLAEAERMAKAALYEANKNESTATIEVVGDTRLVAGVTVLVEGFGRFDGKYLIHSATHSVGAGYVTSIDLSNTREEVKGAVGPDGLEEIIGE